MQTATTQNTQTEQTTKKRKHFAQLVENFRYAMLASKQPQSMQYHARPMRIIDYAKDTMTLRFITDISSNKVDEIIRHPHTTVTMQDGATCLSLSGYSRILKDNALIDAYWTPQMNIWFEGANDDDIAIIEFKPQHCEYWDMNAGSLVSLILQEAAAFFTGKDVNWRHNIHDTITN